MAGPITHFYRRSKFYFFCFRTRKAEPTLEEKKKKKKLGFFFPSKASSESEAGSSFISREDVSRQKMERI